MTHTPGPWSARHNGHYWQIQAGDYDLIGDACASQFDDNGLKTPATLAKAEANARLIAAAPELLEALRPLAFFSGSFADEEDRDRLNDLFAAARAAISKGEGR